MPLMLYTLFEQDGSDYLGRSPEAGNYQLVITPYAQDDAQGEAGEPLTINFFVQGIPPVSQVTGLMLVDAATNQDAGLLMDGDVIDLTNFPEGFSGRALLDGPVGSVRFAVGDVERVENIAAFTLFEQEGDVYLGRSPAPGDYQLTITPYAIDDAAGEAGEPLTINFTITGGDMDNEARRLTHPEKPLIADQVSSFSLTALSNPGADRVTVDTKGLTGQVISVQVIDPAGQLVEQKQYTVLGDQDQFELELNQRTSGVYIVNAQVGKLYQYLRVIK